MTKKPILFDHDGSVDDFLSLVLLLTMPNTHLLGVSITPADCYAENALETTKKILYMANRTHTEVSVGRFHGVNAFPPAWRAKPKILNALPELIGVEVGADPYQCKDSKDLLSVKIRASEAPVTILMTGPCSNLVQALQADESLVSNISQVIWMGGAFEVDGNVATYNHNGTAEWNVFWDPLAAQELLNYELDLLFVPLNATNDVPVSLHFLKQLAKHSDHKWAHLAGQFWATTLDTIPAYEYTYFMWDVLATSYLQIPDAFEVKTREITIDAIGPSAGRTYYQEGSGKWAKVATKVNKEVFYDYLIQAFTSLS
ncbi:MAG TPA: nucleoside hydrolase [Cytophagales bacterium]|nr:nucleoside hydrolase [Cytophagales bacterium]HAA20853.1 nucleoside hydrolase [Cytophagales bacterium]HAP59141.1 nucleoside hydrolase [Cytophagales bacterium]